MVIVIEGLSHSYRFRIAWNLYKCGALLVLQYHWLQCILAKMVVVAVVTAEPLHAWRTLHAAVVVLRANAERTCRGSDSKWHERLPTLVAELVDLSEQKIDKLNGSTMN